MAIDKALYEAPQGLASIDQAPPVEIEIEDPESVKISMDGLEIDIEKAEDTEEFNKNLAEELTEGELALLAGDLIGDFDGDVASRKDWIQTYVDGLELLGLSHLGRLLS